MTAFSPALHRFGDVSVRLSVELGRTDMPLRDVLSLGEGSVVSLNRLTDELLDVTANGKVIARGEVVAQDGRFALRIVSLAGSEDDVAETSSTEPRMAPANAPEPAFAASPQSAAEPSAPEGQQP
ncbi:MAG: flagellar motor switch protein FliN [Erythrobacter sp.]